MKRPSGWPRAQQSWGFVEQVARDLLDEALDAVMPNDTKARA